MESKDSKLVRWFPNFSLYENFIRLKMVLARLLLRTSVISPVASPAAFQKRWQATQSTVNLTVEVQRRVTEKRGQALLGGGEKRIETQHHKVCFKVGLNNLTYYCLNNPQVQITPE